MKNSENKSLAKKWFGGGVALLFVCSTVWAAPVQPQENDYRVAHRQKFQERKTELLELKEKDPEKFKALVTQKRDALHKRLAQLKEKDPEKYKEVVGKIRQRRMARWQKLKQENPKEFQRLMQQRRQHLKERLEVLKKENPEKYEKIVAFKQDMEKHPRLKDGQARRHQDHKESSEPVAEK
ncbi:MAG: hypothetical protein V1863_01735 [Candidatus Omnitrophota bacterium]